VRIVALTVAATPQKEMAIPEAKPTIEVRVPQVPSPQPAAEIRTNETTGWAEIVARTRPAVVVIETNKGFGSGFVVRPDGTIVTNHHVVANASEMAVKFASGEVYRNVYLLNSDAIEDLAFLKIEAVDLPTIPMGNSSTVQVGEDVLLVGAPRGLEQTVSNGLISAIRLDDGVRVIQTTAAASPGSSGGPLLNRGGEAIGVMSFKIVNGENLNFTIPINYVRGKLETLAFSSKLQAFDPLKSGTAKADKHSGVWVAGYGYPSGSFQAVFMGVVDFLSSSGVTIANYGPQKFGSLNETGFMPLSTLMDAVSKAGADSLLYVKVEQKGWGGVTTVYLQCFDSAGKPLWEEKATSPWADGSAGVFRSGWKKKLSPHVGQAGLIIK
jgi:S1-C subfamily serine protease